MAILPDLPVALARIGCLPFARRQSLEEMRTFWNEVGGLGLPVTARLFWNDAFMALQFLTMGREPREKRVLTDVTVTANVSPVKSTMRICWTA